MAKTANQIFYMALADMDEILDSGEISLDDTISYQVKAPYLINQMQQELIRDSEFYNSEEFSFSPIKTVGGDFNVREHYSDDEYLLGGDQTQAYYFEVDGTATVYIEDYDGSWNTLETISATSTSGFTAYKGTVTPTASATNSRIRFSGSYFYRFRNTALFNANFETVPDYRPFVKVDMPSDFGILVEVVKEYYKKYYVSGEYKLENNSDLYVSYDFEGSLRINYRPNPTLITALTDTLSIDDYLAVSVLPYGLAAKLLIHEDLTKADYFEQKYQEALYKVRQPKPAEFDDIEDIYGGFNG